MNNIPKRIWDKVYKNHKNGCLEWIGYKNKGGYGITWVDKKAVPAHRYFYEVFIGKIPTHLEIDHLCRNRCCVNPIHLEAVTHTENIRRGDATRATKTHCHNGHLKDDNFYIRKPKTGKRPFGVCRICTKEYNKKHHDKYGDEGLKKRRERYNSDSEHRARCIKSMRKYDLKIRMLK